MKAIYGALLVVVLAGCSTAMEYKTVAVTGDPKKVIERVLMEQPRKYHPDYVSVTDDYVEYGGVTYSKAATAGLGPDVTRRDVKRMYWKSITENRLFSRGRWWLVKSANAQGRLIGEAWVGDEASAVQYISALDAMKKSQPAE
jgi:hypothetical protein